MSKMAVYNTQNLKEQFADLSKLEDEILIPLMETVFRKWTVHLQNSNSVSDFKKRRAEMFSHHEEYCCVIDGKIVELYAQMEDIDAVDEDETWYVINRVSFSGDKESAEKLLQNFRGFVETQNLDELVKDSANELEKGKTYHLYREVFEFYFRRVKCQVKPV